MKFYQVELLSNEDGSVGYRYFTSQREAQKAINDWVSDEGGQDASLKIIDIKPTKQGILQALNRLAGHADNG